MQNSINKLYIFCERVNATSIILYVIIAGKSCNHCFEYIYIKNTTFTYVYKITFTSLTTFLSNNNFFSIYNLPKFEFSKFVRKANIYIYL